jgi:hypothetical protein
MRFLLCLTLLVSTACAFEQQAAAGDTVIGSGLAPVPFTQPAQAVGCTNCQGHVGHHRMGAPVGLTHDGCRANACAQAQAAGLHLGCCDPDMRPYFGLWADYCSEQHGCHLFKGGCGCHGCQVRSWGRGGSGCGVGGCGLSCGLGLLGHRHGRHHGVTGACDTSACTDCGSGDDTLSGGAVSNGAADGNAPSEPRLGPAGPVDNALPAVSDPLAPPMPPPPAEPAGSALRFRRIPRPTAEVSTVDSGFAQPAADSLPVAPAPNVWQRLMGRFGAGS